MLSIGLLGFLVWSHQVNNDYNLLDYTVYFNNFIYLLAGN